MSCIVNPSQERYNPIWWAIINVIIIELGLIIPPIGIVNPDHQCDGPADCAEQSLPRVMPFIAADMLILVLLTLFPAMALWLPTMLR